ncbi:MAG: DUF3999 domain-containing protein [Acidobacteriia bacterium]|nr:DUF3999 domain-containing protein [Terriglobia bacterium]
MMRTTWGLLAVLLVTSPAILYFKYQRKLAAPTAGGQHYAAVDETIWEHALPDLDDLRLYAGGKEIPYTRKIMYGSSRTEQKSVRLLQPGTLGGETQFLLDMSGVPEYDRITLDLAAKNYVAHARVDGQDDPHGTKWANLGMTTLFDLSDEKLGHNSTLQIPVSTYNYLRVTLEGPVKPADVQGATAGIERAQQAVWRELGSALKQTQEGKDTVLTAEVSRNIPVERVLLTIDPAQGNFQRGMEVQDGKGSTVSTGEIRRIHLQRNGQKIDVEQTWLDLNATGQGKLRAVIHNGDDAPLKITGARLEQYERRIYFDCDAGTSLEFYYGDGKLNAPVYDYAQLFQTDANAGPVQLDAEEANAAYTGRPDERPWSERHPAVLWAAILAAVAVLGGIAVRSMKNAGA